MLSIFAHLLFCVYAYGTRIFVDYALLTPERPMQVHLIMGGDVDDSGESTGGGNQSVDPSEWSEPSDTAMIDPPPADLPRIEADFQVPNPIVASQVVGETAPEVPLPSLENEPSKPPVVDVPLPEAPDNFAAATDAAPITSDTIENDVAETQTPPEEPTPLAAPLERQLIEPVASELPSAADAADEEESDGQSELQTLAENLTGRPADALIGETDTTSAAGASGIRISIASKCDLTSIALMWCTGMSRVAPIAARFFTDGRIDTPPTAWPSRTSRRTCRSV
jgi:hypothetical protein